MKKDFNTFKTLAKRFNTMLFEYSEICKHANNELSNSVYAIKKRELEKNIKYINSELDYFKKVIGEKETEALKARYINNELIEDVAKSLGYSRREFYLKLKEWINKYER